MKKLSVMILIASLGTQIDSGAVANEERPLSYFTDEQIALEFQKRWVELTKKYSAESIIELLSMTEEEGGKGEAELISAIRAFEDTTFEARDALKPFADIGFMPARGELGGLMIYDNSLDTRCAGYEMLREAALYGHPFDLFQFQMLFDPSSGVKADKDLYYLLGRELVHRLPSVYEKRFPAVQQGYSSSERAELEVKWISWSVENIDAQFSPECKNTEQ